MLQSLLAHRVAHLVVATLLASGPLVLSALPEAAAPVPRPRPLRGGHLVPDSRLVDTLADIPAEWRKPNWIGPRGQGSCVHAAMRHLLHWQGQHELAEFWERNFSDGETFGGLALKLDRTGVRWAGTSDGDESFLAWAIRTRRGAGVVVQSGAHMVNLVGLDTRWAYILDSNSIDRLQKWDRDRFLADWHRSGGWAVTPVYTPPPPQPHSKSLSTR